MENEDNREEPMIQIVEVRRASPRFIIKPILDNYNRKNRKIPLAFNSVNSDANLKKLGRRLDYFI